MSKLEAALSSYQAALERWMRKAIPSDLYDSLDEFQRMFDVASGIDPLLMVERYGRIPSITIANSGTGYTSPPAYIPYVEPTVLEGLSETVTETRSLSDPKFIAMVKNRRLVSARKLYEAAINGIGALCKQPGPIPPEMSFMADWMAFQETERAEATAKAERDGMKEYPGSWPPPRMGFPPGSAY
jgi:hypothetical protein